MENDRRRIPVDSVMNKYKQQSWKQLTLRVRDQISKHCSRLAYRQLFKVILVDVIEGHRFVPIDGVILEIAKLKRYPSYGA